MIPTASLRFDRQLLNWLRYWVFLAAAILLGVLGPSFSSSAKAQPSDPKAGQISDPMSGEKLVRIANCAYCHGHKNQPDLGLSGGRQIDAWFGKVDVPNITPDPDVGIGRWTRAMFADAIRHGRSPNGIRYQSVFPTDNYAALNDAEIGLIFDYLMAQPARSTARPAPPDNWTTIGPSLSRFLRLIDRWRLDAFQTQAPPADPSLRDGYFLVQVLGHCAQCHTPRDWLGRLDKARAFAGSYRPLYGGGKAPNISPDMKTGIGGWSVEEIASYLKDGQSPEFRDAKGSMADYIHAGLDVLSADERAQIARYLLSLPPHPSEIK